MSGFQYSIPRSRNSGSRDAQQSLVQPCTQRGRPCIRRMFRPAPAVAIVGRFVPVHVVEERQL